MIVAAHLPQLGTPVFLALTYNTDTKAYDTVSDAPYYKTKHLAWEAIKTHLSEAVKRHRRLTVRFQKAYKSGSHDEINAALNQLFSSQISLLGKIDDICSPPSLDQPLELSVDGRDIKVYRVVNVGGPVSVIEQLQELLDHRDPVNNLTDQQTNKLLLACSSILDTIFNMGNQLKMTSPKKPSQTKKSRRKRGKRKRSAKKKSNNGTAKKRRES